jgi:hypothetical protein
MLEDLSTKSKTPEVRSEEEKPTEELNFEKPDYSFIPNGMHDWRQQGPYLVCKSCEIQHAVWIGIEKVMIGISEDGKPVLKKFEG